MEIVWMEDNLTKDQIWTGYPQAEGSELPCMSDEVILLDPDQAPLYVLVRQMQIDNLAKKLGVSKEHASKIIDTVNRFEAAGLST